MCITLQMRISESNVNEILRRCDWLQTCRMRMLQLGCSAPKKNVGHIRWLLVTDKSGFLHSKRSSRCTSCTRFIHRPDTTGACGNIWLLVLYDTDLQATVGQRGAVATRGPEVEPLGTLFISSDVLGDVSCFFYLYEGLFMPNFSFEWIIKLLLPIREVLGSNIGLEIDCPEVYMVFVSPSKQISG